MSDFDDFDMDDSVFDGMVENDYLNPDKVRRSARLAKNATKKRRVHERTLRSAYRNARKLLSDAGKSHYRTGVKSALRRGDYDNGILTEDYYLDPWDWN